MPSARVREPLRVLLDPRVVRRALQREVERDLQAELAGARRRRRRSRRSCRGRGGSRRGRPRPSRSPRASPGSSRARGQRVVRALAVDACRSGGSAAGRRRRSPSRRRRAAARPRCEGARTQAPSGRASAPSERGKNSYQEPNSARSPVDPAAGSGSLGRSPGRAAGAGRAARRPRAPGRRPGGPAPGALRRAARPRRRAAAWRRPRRARPAAARSNSRAPSSSISSTSTPAWTLIGASWRQVPSGSLQASTANVQWPGRRRGRPSALQRSVPGASGRIGMTARACRAGSRRTTFAATASCPSRNTVAATSKVSPATALAGRAPQATVGLDVVIGMRPIIALRTVPIGRSIATRRTVAVQGPARAPDADGCAWPET